MLKEEIRARSKAQRWEHAWLLVERPSVEEKKRSKAGRMVEKKIREESEH